MQFFINMLYNNSINSLSESAELMRVLRDKAEEKLECLLLRLVRGSQRV